jgi:hypothetical protein
MVKAAQQIISIGALAASGVGAAGAGAIGTGAVGTTTTGLGATGTMATGGNLTGGALAMNHLNAAQQLTQTAGTLDAMGLHAPAAYNRSLAHGHELAARQAELGERMQRFDGVQPQAPSQDFGFSPSVNTVIQSNFSGSTQDFQRGFQDLSPHIAQHGFDPNVLAAQYPADTARMVQAYLSQPDEINQARDPLYRAAELGNASELQNILTFMSGNPPNPSSQP